MRSEWTVSYTVDKSVRLQVVCLCSTPQHIWNRTCVHMAVLKGLCTLWYRSDIPQKWQQQSRLTTLQNVSLPPLPQQTKTLVCWRERCWLWTQTNNSQRPVLSANTEYWLLVVCVSWYDLSPNVGRFCFSCFIAEHSLMHLSPASRPQWINTDF